MSCIFMQMLCIVVTLQSCSTRVKGLKLQLTTDDLYREYWMAYQGCVNYDLHD